MKRTPKIIGIHLLSVLVLTVATVILRTIASIRDYDYATGYYDGKLLITIGNYITAFTCLIAASHLFFGRSIAKYKASFQHPLIYIPAGAVCIALVFFAADNFGILASLPGGLFSHAALSGSENLMTLAVSLLALASLGYFVLTHAIERVGSPERAIFGIVFTAFLALCATNIYFNSDAHINSYVKITDQLAFVFAAVFFLFDTRISLEREVWSGYIAFGGIAATLAAYSSIPSIIVYFVKGAPLSPTLAQSVLMLAVFALIAARLSLVTLLPEDRTSETAEAISFMSEERIRYIEESRLNLAREIQLMEENRVDAEHTAAQNYNYSIDIDQLNSDSSEGEG